MMEYKYLIFVTIVASLHMEQGGLVLGWSSPVLTVLQSENSPIPITSDQGSWIATILPLSSLFCTSIAAVSIQYLGRKLSVGITVIPYLISWIMIGVATTVTELLIARCIAGIGLALTYVTIPVYFGEISPDSSRGSIGMFMNVVSAIGVLRIYCTGNIINLWLSSLISAFPLIVIIICYKWLPESPYYLMMKNCKAEAEITLQKLRNSKNVNEELTKIELIVGERKKGSSLKELFQKASHRRALIICLGVMTFAQCTGATTFLFYAHLIFEKAGTGSANSMSIIKAVLELFSCVGSAYVVENTGKKPLLIISCIGSVVFMICEGVYFQLHDSGVNVEGIWWLPLTAMILFNISQAVGLGPISIAYLGEMFHPKVKSFGVFISKAYMALAVFTVGKLYQIITDYVGSSVPFFIFALMGVLGCIFVIFVVPETRGKSLDDIQYYMTHKKYPENIEPISTPKII